MTINIKEILILTCVRIPLAIVFSVLLMLSGVAVYILVVQSTDVLEPLCKVESITYNDSVAAK